jgi:hypothetical protein
MISVRSNELSMVRELGQDDKGVSQSLQPNHGRGSTYRRAKSVQTTGTRVAIAKRAPCSFNEHPRSIFSQCSNLDFGRIRRSGRERPACGARYGGEFLWHLGEAGT